MKGNTIELFSRTRSFSKVAKKLGYSTFCIELDKNFKADLHTNILKVSLEDIPNKHISHLWASPPCNGFSVAVIGRNWDKRNFCPKTDSAREGLKLLDKTISLISDLLKKNTDMFFYIENPRAMMRLVIDNIFSKYGIINYVRRTVTYCQYGDRRQKPTDIWTNNFNWIPRPICSKNDRCHEPAPRGSKTGTQGLNNKTLRGVIPEEIFREIFSSVENTTRIYRNQLRLEDFN